jgi:two-component system cell cycle sensor histidine kinase PleC
MSDLKPAEADKIAVNRQRAERRRAVARTVRDHRERLASSTGTRPAFDFELLVTYARNRKGAIPALLLVVLLVGGTALLWVDPIWVASWAAAVAVLQGVTFLLCRRLLASAQSAVRVRLWTTRFALAELVGGAAWCALLVLSWMAPPAESIAVFQFAVAVVIISAGTMVAATVPPAALTGTLPMVLTAAILFASRGETLYYAMATLVGVAELFFLLLANRFYWATLGTLESKAEKDALIGELGTAKAISDESRRRAEEANLAKSRFLATMSHELRTPLNAILGFSEVMKNEVLGPMQNKAYREYAGDIHQSGTHLLNLINEILDLSRIEAGRYKLSEEPVHLAHLVEECRHLVQLKAKSKGIVIDEVIEPNLPRLWADARAVRQVMLNLLSNAVKFTQPGGRIEVKVGWTSGGGQYVTVADNGPGIPEEEIPIVLSAFGQGSIAIKGAEEGTGLGLPIVQALMHTHDGSFELSSKLRQGTTATAIFPRTRVMEALPPIDDASRLRLRRTG